MTSKRRYTENMPDEEIRAELKAIIEKAKAHWDSLGKPYPPPLQSAIDFLKKV